jgi:hypothetical protein
LVPFNCGHWILVRRFISIWAFRAYRRRKYQWIDRFRTTDRECSIGIVAFVVIVRWNVAFLLLFRQCPGVVSVIRSSQSIQYSLSTLCHPPTSPSFESRFPNRFSRSEILDLLPHQTLLAPGRRTADNRSLSACLEWYRFRRTQCSTPPTGPLLITPAIENRSKSSRDVDLANRDTTWLVVQYVFQRETCVSSDYARSGWDAFCVD